MSRHPKGGFDAFMQWSQSKRTKPVDVEQSDLTGNFLNSGQQQYLKQQFTSPVAAVHPMQSVQQQMQRPVQKQQPVYNMQPPALQFLKPQPTHHMQPSGAQQNFPVRQQQFPAPSHASPNAAYSGIKAPSVNDSNSNYQPPSPSKLINSVLQTHSAPQTSSAVESGDWADTIPVAASKQETSRPPSTTRSSGTDQRIPVSSSKHLRRPSNGTSLTTQEAAMSKFLSVNDVINISDELSKLVGDTMSLLANVTDKDKEAEAAAEAAELKHREETKAKREEERLRMQNLITRLEHEKMPRWRHVQLGHDLKLLPPGMILKGKDLFRCVAYAVLKLYSKPLLMVRKKHLAARKIERDDLQKTLRLYLDPCSSWLAKIVKIPMISIQKDPTLNFSLAWDVFESKQHFNVRMLQLKVRTKSIVNCLTSSSMPNERITRFLITLTDNGNYFVDNFLYEFEKEHMEFNTLGATINVVVPLSDDDPRLLHARAQDAMMQEEDNEDTHELGTGRHRHEDLLNEEIELERCQRVRMLLQNFVLIRILIGRVILSPWHCGICTRPHAIRASTVLTNQRVLASCLYEILRELDPKLPNIVVAPYHDEVAAAPTLETVDGQTGTGLAVDVDIELGNSKGQDGKTKHLGPNLEAEREGDIFGFGQVGSVKSAKSYHLLKEVTQDQNLFQRVSAYFFNFQAQTSNLGIFVYNSLIERAMDKMYVKSNRTEETLLAERHDYETMEETHRYLYSSDGADVNDLHRIIKPFVMVWAAELKGELSDWLDKLTMHVLTTKRELKQRRYDGDAEMGHADGEEGQELDL